MLRGVFTLVFLTALVLIAVFSLIPKAFVQADGNLLHFIGYAAVSAIAVSWLWLAGTQLQWAVVITAFFVSIFAVATELLQIPVPVRTASLSDLGMDFVGVGTGVVSATMVLLVYRKVRWGYIL